MKFAVPEISWHNRDPVLSVDFQPRTYDSTERLRLASGGTDSHVLIWYVSASENGSVNLEVAADLNRHQKAVNVVRWSPNGQYLASGDDESIIFIWKQKTDDKEPAAVAQNLEQDEEQNKETWIIHKTLRGHMEDVLDLSWSPNSNHIVSGSVDNKLMLWDVTRGKYTHILTDHKGFVQGVTWDPKEQLLATASSDRVFRTFDVNTKKVVSRSSKATLPFPSDHPLHNVSARLYHDDTLQTYYRRLHFSPDGLLIAVPAGKIEPEQGKLDIKPINAVYIYTRYSLKVPLCVLPCGEPAVACRWSPRRYRPRRAGPAPALPLRARQLLAVATKRCVLLYDTQQRAPVALVSNIHYTRLTDLTWSSDGLTLVASSTDGFCSVITFSPGELGEEAPDDPVAEIKGSEVPTECKADEQQVKVTKEKTPDRPKPSNGTPKIDAFIKFKEPSEKSQKKRKIETVKVKTPVKLDLLVDTAMPSWHDNSSNDVIKPAVVERMEVENQKESEVMIIEDSDDIKLVYEETENKLGSELQDGKSDMTTEESKEKSLEDSSGKKSTPEKSPPLQDNLTDSEERNISFLKQAKVTDIKESVAVKTVASPKAPRRVNFITLSSPKTSKKKL